MIFEAGDLVEYVVYIGRHSPGDTTFVVYVSGDFVDLEDNFGGERNKKGAKGVQRVKFDQIRLLEKGKQK